MDRVDVDGLSIAYRRAGKGPLLFLLHGALSDSRYWRRQMESFGADFTVVARLWWIRRLTTNLRTRRLRRHTRPVHRRSSPWPSTRARPFPRRDPGDRPARPTSRRRAVSRSGLAYAGWAGSLPPAEVQRRVQGVLRDLERPVDEVAREFVATLLPPDAPAGWWCRNTW